MEELGKHSDKDATSSGDHGGQENASEEVSAQSSGCESDSRPVDSAPRRSRLKLFNKVMEKSLQRLIADASFQRFARSFHPLYKKNPQMTEVIHKQFITDLQKAIQDDISKVIEEGELEFKLEELDRLEEQDKVKSEPAWRPSGVPEQDVCSSLVPYYQAQEEYLRRELKKLRRENAELAERVQAGRHHISLTEQRITVAVEEWKAMVGDLEATITSLCQSEPFESF